MKSPIRSEGMAMDVEGDDYCDDARNGRWCRMTLLLMLSSAASSLAGCSSHSYVSSDFPVVAEVARKVLIEAPNSVLCPKDGKRVRSVESGGGITGARVTYREECESP